LMELDVSRTQVVGGGHYTYYSAGGLLSLYRLSNFGLVRY